MCFRILWGEKIQFVLSVMGSKLSCIKGSSHQSRSGHDDVSGSGNESTAHPDSSVVDLPSSRRIVVSQNGRQIIRTVRSLQSGDAIVVSYPRTDLRTLILDTLRLLRRLVAK